MIRGMARRRSAPGSRRWRTTLRTVTRITLPRAKRRSPRKRAASACSWQLYIDHCPKEIRAAAVDAQRSRAGCWSASASGAGPMSVRRCWWSTTRSHANCSGTDRPSASACCRPARARTVGGDRGRGRRPLRRADHHRVAGRGVHAPAPARTRGDTGRMCSRPRGNDQFSTRVDHKMLWWPGHRLIDSVRVCSSASRRVAPLRPRFAGLTALTPAPRTLVQTGSCRRCPILTPYMLWSTNCAESGAFEWPLTGWAECPSPRWSRCGRPAIRRPPFPFFAEAVAAPSPGREHRRRDDDGRGTVGGGQATSLLCRPGRVLRRPRAVPGRLRHLRPASYTASQRRQEIGIRMALGARRGERSRPRRPAGGRTRRGRDPPRSPRVHRLCPPPR